MQTLARMKYAPACFADGALFHIDTFAEIVSLNTVPNRLAFQR